MESTVAQSMALSGLHEQVLLNSETAEENVPI